MYRRGEFRTRVTIQRRESLQDVTGEQVQTWTSVPNGVVWAKVEHISGREIVGAQGVRVEDTHRITLEFVPGLSEKDRFVAGRFDGSVDLYNITHIHDVDARHRYMECTAVAGLGPG
jgi:SPP1 family predicted phage head-tail adaptor